MIERAHSDGTVIERRHDQSPGVHLECEDRISNSEGGGMIGPGRGVFSPFNPRHVLGVLPVQSRPKRPEPGVVAGTTPTACG